MPFKKILVLVILTIFIKSLSAQEYLIPLQSNPVKLKEEKKDVKAAGLKEGIVLELPFFEDFSYPGPYPDQNLWIDSFAYVNSCYPLHPVSIGVATFDAIDQHGKIYEHAQSNRYQFVADHLTSHKIRLDSVFKPSPAALKPEDSVVFSFYFQPQGSGMAPNDRDSLVLEFLHTPAYYYIDDSDDEEEEEDENKLHGQYSDNNGNNGDTVWVDDKWVSIWRSEGMTLSEFSKDTFPYFKRASIPITDEVYFREDFQFRFKNYSSFPITKNPSNYAGNRNIWNIDYIILDHGRSEADTFYYDLTFAKPAQSMLRRFTAMPWSHYIVNPESHLKSNLEVYIKNLNNEVHNYTYRYHINDEQGNTLRIYSGGTWNIAPFHEDGYQDYHPHTKPIVLPNPFPTAPAEKRHFQIVHSIKEGATGDDNRRNDTVIYDQVFDNYFAYDNGIPNAGYILEGFEPMSASRFILSHPDTIRGVQIFFNHTLDQQNNSPFHLMVWKSLDPENVVYESEVVMPEYAGELSKFYTYSFEDEPVLIKDTFYIGWKQITSDPLNVGYDLNSSAGGNIFYNTAGKWHPSIFDGALMVRPIVGGKSGETQITDPEKPQTLSVTFYPNPVRGDYLNVKIDGDQFQNGDDLYIQIFDMQGRLLASDKLQQSISVKNYPNGIYILRVFNKNSSESITERVIISR